MAAGRDEVPEDRVLLIGAPGVGKNSLIEQFCYGHVSEDYDPFRGEGCRKALTIDGEPCALDLLDVDFTDGAPSTVYDLRAADAVMLVFSVASLESLRSAMEAYAWLQWQQMGADDDDDEERAPVVLVGNMCDLGAWREVAPEAAAQLARGLGMAYVETSAWDAAAVNSAFVGLTRAAMLRRRRQQQRYGQASRREHLASAARKVKAYREEEGEEEEGYGHATDLAQAQPQTTSPGGHRLRGHRFLSWGRSKLSLRPVSQMPTARGVEHRTQKIQEGLVDAARRNDGDMFAWYMRAAAAGSDSEALPRRSGSSSGSFSSTSSVAAAVHVAAEAGHGRILELVMEQQQQQQQGMTAAATNHSYEEPGLTLPEVNTPDAEGTPPLQLAAKQGHGDVVRLLLSQGALIDQTSPRYGTALSAAAMHRRDEVVGLLLEHGASLDVRSTVYGDLVQELARERDGRIAAHLEQRLRREHDRELRARWAREMACKAETARRAEAARLAMRELPPPPWHLRLDLPEQSFDVDFGWIGSAD